MAESVGREKSTLPNLFGPITSLLSGAELVYVLTRRRIVSRYRGAALGLVWSVLQPALTLGIFTLVFGVMFRSRWSDEATSTTEYALLLYLGLCVYWFVADCLGEAPNLIIDHHSYVKKVVFPLELLPWVLVCTALFHTVVRLAIFVVAWVVLRGAPPITILWLPIVWIPLTFATLGLCWLFSALGVLFRDLREGVGLMLSAMMFLSPIFYSLSAVPEAFRPLVLLNPVTAPVLLARDVAAFGRTPDATMLALAFLASGFIAWMGLAFFMRLRGGFADAL